MTEPGMTTDTTRSVRGFFAEIQPGRKGEILDAALQEFAERGYEGGPLQRIAERVGVSEPALYRHFPSKRALFETFIRLAAQRLVSEGGALADDFVADAAAVANPTSALAAVLSDRGEMASRFQLVIRTIAAEVLRDDAMMRVWQEELLTPLAEVAEQIVRAVDAEHGVARDVTEMQDSVRVFMTMFIGHVFSSFTCAEDNSQHMALAMCAAMGWE